MQAQYDSAGNIILSSDQEVSVPEKEEVMITETGVKEVSSTWKTSKRDSVKSATVRDQRKNTKYEIRNTKHLAPPKRDRIAPFEEKEAKWRSGFAKARISIFKTQNGYSWVLELHF